MPAVEQVAVHVTRSSPRVRSISVTQAGLPKKAGLLLPPHNASADQELHRAHPAAAGATSYSILTLSEHRAVVWLLPRQRWCVGIPIHVNNFQQWLEELHCSFSSSACCGAQNSRAMDGVRSQPAAVGHNTCCPSLLGNCAPDATVVGLRIQYGWTRVAVCVFSHTFQNQGFP
jgi:hypothetical protein